MPADESGISDELVATLTSDEPDPFDGYGPARSEWEAAHLRAMADHHAADPPPEP